MGKLIAFGLRQLAAGSRRGNPGLAALGAAALGVGWLRRRARPRPELVYSRRLKPGDALSVRVSRQGDIVED